jgi:hypothetical protein
MTLEENVKQLSTLIEHIKLLASTVEESKKCIDNTYAYIIMGNHPSTTTKLNEVLTTPEISDIANYIHDVLLTKHNKLKAELNSHIISKQI